jgi:adenylylsulfate kinase
MLLVFHGDLSAMQPDAYAHYQSFAVEPSFDPSHRGAVVWITGLAATGKSRLAAALSERLQASVEVEVLDGDDVRRYLSKNHDGSREGGAAAVARLGFVARLLARHGVIVIAPALAFDEGTRAELRRAAEDAQLRSIEVFMEADVDALIESGARSIGHAARRRTPDVTVRPDWQGLDDSVDRIVRALVSVGAVTSPQPDWCG